MKFDKRGIQQLQWSIALLALMITIGAAAVWSTAHLLARAEQELLSAIAQRRDIQARLGRARDEEQELRKKIAHYQLLETHGRIGPERRLDWLEAIAAIKTSRRIHGLEYEFSPQHPADAVLLPGGASAGVHDVMTSTMHLRMPLLHEGDLLNFIGDLKRSVQALVIVRNCTIERARNPDEHGGTAPLAAECTLEWITLSARK